jgi:hypothetical protein
MDALRSRRPDGPDKKPITPEMKATPFRNPDLVQ